MRVLEVSLRKAGFTVTTAVSVQDALDKLELDAPDLIISETTFPDGDGFDLRRRVRAIPEWAEIPFIFLTAEAAIENKIRGLELGVDDYLTKPIYIKEIVTRINILLQKRQRARFEERRDGRTRFAGRVADMPVVDVIQTIEISRKSGVIQFTGERGRQAAIYFRDGRVIDAEANALQGEDAVYRLLTWSEGEFEVVFRTVRRREVIQTSSQGLLMEGMRRLDEWSRLLEQLPPLTHRFEVDTGELAQRLGDVPDDNNAILRLLDGKRTLLEVIDNCDVGDLECLQAISRLYFEELLIDLDHGARPRRDTGKPVPLVEVDTPSPFEESASGPQRALWQRDGNEPAVPALREAESRSAALATARSQAAAAKLDDEIETKATHDVDQVIDATDEPGALAGNYRQSSLMLIDAAVAAAQAIEPSLFDDEEVDRLMNEPTRPVPAATPEAPSTNGVHDSVPEATARQEQRDPLPKKTPPEKFESVRPRTLDAFDAETPPDRPRPGLEDSGLRMIGSLGRDRAETSGEVQIGTTPVRAETQRELVTILPRRVTREVPVFESSTFAEAVKMPPSPTPPVETPSPAKPVDPPAPLSGPPRVVSLAGGVRRTRGPGPGATVLLALAGVLSIVAVYLYVTRSGKQGATTVDAQLLVTPTIDAAPATPDAIETVGMPDAMIVQVPIDAGIKSDKPDKSERDEINAQAKKLFDDARKAFDESEHAQALELIDQSLKLRKTARGYILRGQVLQRLGRVDEALAALAEAEPLAAPHRGRVIQDVYEWRARILWSVRRRDEARSAMEKYLELAPEGSASSQFKTWLEDPR